MVTPQDLIHRLKSWKHLTRICHFLWQQTSQKNQFNKIQKPSNTCVIKYKGLKMFWDEGNSHGVQETTLKNLSHTFLKCRNYNLAT